MELNLSYEMIHELMRASQARSDMLSERNRSNTMEYDLLLQFEEMANEILTEAKSRKQFSYDTINKEPL